MMTANYEDLPADLPVPEDDGAAAHLAGAVMPSVSLPATTGGTVDLSALGPLAILYVYPMTGTPGVALPDGWDDVPGARGCTPESLGFRSHYDELTALGARVFGLSVQTTAEQAEAAERLALPFPLLSDSGLVLAERLQLPTFTAADGVVRYKRITLVLNDATITHVFYPIFPPNGHAAEVLSWLQAQSA
jgi:peroxiredoxin